MVRRCADWPTSVVSISARLGPSQSSDASPDAFRNGRIAREACANGAPAFAAEPEKMLRRKTIPAAASKIMAAIPAIHIRYRWKGEPSADLGAATAGEIVGAMVLMLVGLSWPRSSRISRAAE